jgi:thioester reductase-like protein
MANVEGPHSSTNAEHVAQINAFIERYSYLPQVGHASSPSSTATAPTDKVVLLTGTTGNLGSDLLSILLHDPTVRKVYALNRLSPEASSEERVKKQFEEKGLASYLLASPKVVFIDGKLAEPKLGLSATQYDEVSSHIYLFSRYRNNNHQLCQEVTIVIHNAWPIELARPLSYYEPSILGLYHLLALGRALPTSKNPRFIFLSSVASALLWSTFHKNCHVPEELVHDPRVAVGLGYSESKYIAEHVSRLSSPLATSVY